MDSIYHDGRLTAVFSVPLVPLCAVRNVERFIMILPFSSLAYPPGLLNGTAHSTCPRCSFLLCPIDYRHK